MQEGSVFGRNRVICRSTDGSEMVFFEEVPVTELPQLEEGPGRLDDVGRRRLAASNDVLFRLENPLPVGGERDLFVCREQEEDEEGDAHCGGPDTLAALLYEEEVSIFFGVLIFFARLTLHIRVPDPTKVP